MSDHRIASVTFTPPVVVCADCSDPITPTEQDRIASHSSRDLIYAKEPGEPEALQAAFARHRREHNCRSTAGGLGSDHRGGRPMSIGARNR